MYIGSATADQHASAPSSNLLMSAPGSKPARPTLDYHIWRQRALVISGSRYLVSTKPGLVGHGRDDVSIGLLVKHAVVKPGAVVVNMQCGSGLFGVVAALTHKASRVLLTDRSVVAFEAATRTMQDNEIDIATVMLGHGSASLPAGTEADVVAIRIPTEKLAILQLLVDAFATLKIGGQCYIAGATNEGIKSAARIMQEMFGNATVAGHDSGHRVVTATKRGATYANGESVTSPFLNHATLREVDATLRGESVHLFSRPGVFSWEHVDEATTLLAEVMDVKPNESVLDLGCGIGALGIVAAKLSGTGRVALVDSDSESVRCAERGVAAASLANCTVQVSDVASAVINQKFDVVITNPPFHVGKGTDLEVPTQFILDAWKALNPGGRLLLVANRTLPYERTIHQTFGNVTAMHDGPRFKVLLAQR
jgi:16S rRNA (guanine1207-N2)-methyltransferase